MKILLVAVVPLLGFAGENDSHKGSSTAVHVVAKEEFSLVAAQKLADARRRELHGDCGMCIFKERIGDAWVFRTKVGYAGSPAPDITVFPPRAASKNKEPIQAPETTRGK